MQTSFEHEQEEAALDEKKSFEAQLKEASMSLQKVERAFDDEYPKGPIGLQTSYSQERHAAAKDRRLSFEAQLKDASMALQRAERALEDEYSKDAIGLQTSFRQETEAAREGLKQTFEAQLREASSALQRAERAFEDEYPQNAVGLQTSFSEETKAAAKDNKRSFEQQLRDASTALQKAERALDDDYPTSAIGLQTSYQQEREAASKDSRQSFEQQLRDANQAVMEAQKGLNPQAEDGYGKAPIGLETSYVKESQACAKGNRNPLEKELKGNRTPSKAYNDHYEQSPIGLQILYEQERAAAQVGKKQSLSEELDQKRVNAANEMLKREVEKQKLVMDAHDGHYKHMVGFKPTIATNSSISGQSNKQQPGSVQGEGDVCRNVTKFMNNDKWYKQTNEGRQEMTAHHERLQKELAGKSDPTIADIEREMRASKESYAEKLEAQSREVAKMVNQMNGVRAEREMLDKKKFDRKRSPFVDSLEKQYEAKDALISKLRLDIKNAQTAQDEMLEKSIRREKGLRQKLQQAKLNLGTTSTVSTSTDTQAEPERDSLTSAIHEVCTQNNLYNAQDSHAADAVDPKVEADLEAHDKAHDKASALQSKEDGLKAALKKQTPQSDTVKAATATTTAPVGPVVSSLSMSDEPRAATAKSTNSSIEWAEPASYKVLAYDSGNDIIKMEDMPSTFAQHESPVSIAKALSQLYQPARFISHVASLQSKDYQVVSATRDLLVFRKVVSNPATSIVPTKSSKSTASEAATGQNPATAKPNKSQKSSSAQVNPIDGTSTRRHWVPPPTGNYASPTGFVNYDPIFPPEPTEDSNPSEISKKNKDHIVRREEAVFSGSKRTLRRLAELEHRERQRKRGSWRRRVRFAFSVGLTSAAMMYAVGVGAELARGESGGKRREA